MDFWWWIVLAAAVVIVATVVVSRRAVRSGPDPTQVTIAPDVIARIETLCAQGRPVEAIALLRQATGLNLMNAKLIVDRVDRRRRQRTASAGNAAVSTPAVPATGTAAGPAEPQADAEQPSASEIDLDTELHVRSLAAEGRRADAVNLVRARTDWDAEQAARFVDSL